MKKITIHNFGPIQKIENLEIRDFMVFIGPQASGKSTIVKSIYYFKSIRDEVTKYLLTSFDNNVFNQPLKSIAKAMRQRFLDMWGSTLPLHQDLLLKYEYQPNIEMSLTLTQGDKFVNSEFNLGLEKSILDIVDICRNFVSKNGNTPEGLIMGGDKIIREMEIATFKKGIINRVNAVFLEENQLDFVPAGRTALTVLSEEMMDFGRKKVDYLLKEFATRVKEIKPIFEQSLGRIITEQERTSIRKLNTSGARKVRHRIEKILRGEYRVENGEERIYFSEGKGKYVKINYASSGQQESVWILLLIFVSVLYDINTFVVFEEPEAHLFPDAQKEMAELIALLCNAHIGNGVIITTHSPYILTSLNNLFYAYQIGKTSPADAQKIVDKSSWLNPKNSAAYFVESGKITPIMEEGFIQAGRIDEISNKINAQLDQLFEFEK